MTMLKVAASLALLVPAAPLILAQDGSLSLAKLAPAALASTPDAEDKAWLGIGLGETDRSGVMVTSVADGSPAARAGLREGDRIEAADETELSGTGALIDLMATKRPGDALILDIARDGQPMTLLARLATRESEPIVEGRIATADAPRRTTERRVERREERAEPREPVEVEVEVEIDEEPEGRDVGALFRPEESQSGRNLQRALRPVEAEESVSGLWRTVTGESSGAFLGVFLGEADEGARVDSVEEDSAADLAGLRSGDIVIEFNHQPVRDSNDLVELVRAQEPGASVVVIALRNGERIELQAELGAREPDPVSVFSLSTPELNARGQNIFEVPGRIQVPAVPPVPQVRVFGRNSSGENPFSGFDAEAFERDMEQWAEQFENSFEGWAENFELEMENFSEQFEDWSEDLGDAFESDFEMFMDELPDMVGESEVIEKLIDGAARGQALKHRIFSGPEGTKIFRIQGDKQPGEGWNWRELHTDGSDADVDFEIRFDEDGPSFFSERGGGQAGADKQVERLAGRLEQLERELSELRRENAELRARLDRR